MNSLQIAPVSGFKSPSVSTASPVGEATHAPSDSQGKHADASSGAAPQPTPASNTDGQTVNQQIQSARSDAAHAADDKTAKDARDKGKDTHATEKGAAPEPSYDLKIGYQNGTDHVVIDIVDPKLHRTIYRVFGPRDNSDTDDAKDTQDAKAGSTDHSAADKAAADGVKAYNRVGTTGEPAANVKTEV